MALWQWVLLGGLVLLLLSVLTLVGVTYIWIKRARHLARRAARRRAWEKRMPGIPVEFGTAYVKNVKRLLKNKKMIQK